MDIFVIGYCSTHGVFPISLDVFVGPEGAVRRKLTTDGHNLTPLHTELTKFLQTKDRQEHWFVILLICNIYLGRTWHHGEPMDSLGMTKSGSCRNF